MHLLDAFHTVKGPQLEVLAEVRGARRFAAAPILGRMQGSVLLYDHASRYAAVPMKGWRQPSPIDIAAVCCKTPGRSNVPTRCHVEFMNELLGVTPA